MNENDLTSALKDFSIKITKSAILVDGVIKDVDETKATCTVTVSESDFYSVPLKVLKNSKASILEVPKAGTACTIRFKNNNINCPQMYQVHECTKFLVTIGASTLEVTDGLWKFNGGSLDGMVKVNSLITKLNALENTMNTFMNTTYNTHTHISAAPGAPTAPPLPLNTAVFTPTVANDIKNPKITQ